MGVLAVDIARFPLAFVGTGMVAFAFYARFNEGKGPFQLPGGASERATRLFGAALIAIGIMALIGAFA